MVTVHTCKAGGWDNGSAFILCVGDYLLNPRLIPTSAHAFGEVTRCHAGCEDVGRCSTRGGSQGMYITFASAKANNAKPTLALKPRGDITRNSKQEYQWPKNRTHVCVRQTTLKENKTIHTCFFYKCQMTKRLKFHTVCSVRKTPKIKALQPLSNISPVL